MIIALEKLIFDSFGDSVQIKNGQFAAKYFDRNERRSWEHFIVECTNGQTYSFKSSNDNDKEQVVSDIDTILGWNSVSKIKSVILPNELDLGDIKGSKVSLSKWVPGKDLSRWDKEYNISQDGWISLARYFSINTLLKVIDRHDQNIIYDGDKFYSIDHESAFSRGVESDWEVFYHVKITNKGYEILCKQVMDDYAFVMENYNKIFPIIEKFEPDGRDFSIEFGPKSLYNRFISLTLMFKRISGG